MLIDLMNNHGKTFLLDLNTRRRKNGRSKMRLSNINYLLEGDGRRVHIISPN